MKLLLFLLTIIIISPVIANAYIPIKYTCCINRALSDGILIDGFENFSDWDVGKTAVKYIDTINFKEGEQGLKLIAINGSRAYVDKKIYKNFSNVDNFALWIYVENESDFAKTEIYFTSTGSSWSKYFSSSMYGTITGWNRLVFGKNSFINTGGEDWNNMMNRIRIAIYPKATKNTSITVDDLRFNITGKEAEMIIVFDDGYDNIYNNAYPILNANNQSGVVFIITSYVDRKGRLNLSHLRDLQKANWDISSHTTDHYDLTILNETMQFYELNNSYGWLMANKFQKSAGFISYPYGSFNDAVLNKTKQTYIIGRASMGGSTQQHFISTDENARYMQRVINIFNDTSIEYIKNQINDTINSKLLGILVFHEVVDSNPSKYQNLKTDFQKISDYIKSKDIGVVTYSDLMIPNIRNFTPIVNKTVRISYDGSSVLITKNKYDEYMPNMTILPSSDFIDISIVAHNESGGLIKFYENSPKDDLQVTYNIGDRIPNKTYSIRIYEANSSSTKYQDFNIIANSTGYLNYNLKGFEYKRYQIIQPTSNYTIDNSIMPIFVIAIIISIMANYLIRKWNIKKE